MNITDSAITQLSLMYKENNKFIRLAINSGGCAGFSYEFTLSNLEPDDINPFDGFIIDKESYKILKNSTVDYIKEISGSFFKVSVPEATSSCGCNKSFSL